MKADESDINDAKMEAILGKMLKKEPKDLKCKSNNTITRMCINSRCEKQSLICGIEQCKSCNEDDHEECAWIKMKNLVNILNKNTNNRKDVINRISEIDEAFFNNLRLINYQIIKEGSLEGLEEKQRKIMTQIFEKKQTPNLKGKDASQFYQKVRQLSEISPDTKYQNSLIKSYENTVQEFIKVQMKQKRGSWVYCQKANAQKCLLK